MHIKILNRHYLIFLNTKGRTKVASYIPNFRDLTLIIHDVLRDSQSRRIACNWQERCPETIPACSPIHRQWTFLSIRQELYQEKLGTALPTAL